LEEAELEPVETRICLVENDRGVRWLNAEALPELIVDTQLGARRGRWNRGLDAAGERLARLRFEQLRDGRRPDDRRAGSGGPARKGDQSMSEHHPEETMPVVASDLDSPDLSDELIDELLAGARTPEEITGPDGLLSRLTKRLVERAMATELTEHLGYEHGQAPPGGVGNARNGTTAKTIHTGHGSVRIEQPRDRGGSFEPQIVRKHQRRFDGFDDKIVAMYGRGMSVRDIQAHLAGSRCRALAGAHRRPNPRDRRGQPHRENRGRRELHQKASSTHDPQRSDRPTEERTEDDGQRDRHADNPGGDQSIDSKRGHPVPQRASRRRRRSAVVAWRRAVSPSSRRLDQTCSKAYGSPHVPGRGSNTRPE
jgi:putative transposase